VITYTAKRLSNLYDLVFLAVPKKKAGFERINVQTEVANSEIAAPDNSWVPAAGNCATLGEHGVHSRMLVLAKVRSLG
jgi:hypothetical protein